MEGHSSLKAPARYNFRCRSIPIKTQKPKCNSHIPASSPTLKPLSKISPNSPFKPISLIKRRPLAISQLKSQSSLNNTLLPHPNKSASNSASSTVISLSKKTKILSRMVSKQKYTPKDASYEEFLKQSLATLEYIKTFPPVDLQQLKDKSLDVIRRPGFQHRKTIVFDLDETLVHCCNSEELPEVVVKVRLPSGEEYAAGINVRPFAKECLKVLSREFEIFVFTASQHWYADAVCDYLDPYGQHIHQRFYRQHCIVINGIVVKDLRIFKNRRLKDTIIVENTLTCVAYQLDNCIPILSWYSNKNDNELVKVVDYIQAIKDDDIRTANQQHFNLSGIL